MHVLRTTRLTLEPQRAAHAQEMFAVLADPAIYEYENQPPQSLEWLHERYAKLESRRSGDGSEVWLNWVLRLASGELAGYVQATIHQDGSAGVGYELASAHWGRGLGSEAVGAMIEHLRRHHQVHTAYAVLKRANQRSLRLLRRLAFAEAPAALRAPRGAEDDELLMQRVLPAVPAAPAPSSRPVARRFETASFYARELAPGEAAALQALYDANPEYFEIVNGRVPRADEAQREFDDLPPPHLSYSARWFCGLYRRDDDELIGVATGLADFVLPGVSHLSLFFVATRLHGGGAAAELYRGVEQWLAASGAAWLRLGVVRGNTRAEHFWARQGFVELRAREGVDTGGRLNTVCVMMKPLRGGHADQVTAQVCATEIAQYLALMPRDHPDSTLP